MSTVWWQWGSYYRGLILEHSSVPEETLCPGDSHSPFRPLLNPAISTLEAGLSMGLTILTMLYKRDHIMCDLFVMLFSLGPMFPRFIHFVVYIRTHSFVWLHNIPLYGWASFCLSIYQWLTSGFPLWGHCEQYCCENPCASFYVHMYSVFLGKYLVELLDRMVTLFNFLRSR